MNGQESFIVITDCCDSVSWLIIIAVKKGYMPLSQSLGICKFQNRLYQEKLMIRITQ